MNVLFQATCRAYIPGDTLTSNQNVKNSPLNEKNQAGLIADKMKKIWSKCKAYLIPAFLLVGVLGMGFTAWCVMPPVIPIALFLTAIVGLTFTLLALRVSCNGILMCASYQFGKEYKKSLNIAHDVVGFLKEAKKIDANSIEKKEEFNIRLREYGKKIKEESKNFTSFPFIAFLTNELKDMNYENLKEKALTIISFQVQLSRISSENTKTFFISQFLHLINKYDKIKNESGEVTDQEFKDKVVFPILDWKEKGKRTDPKDYPVYIWRTLDEMNFANFKDKTLDILSDFVEENYLAL